MDVFTGYMYWTSREAQKLMRQDKFGRGVNETLLRQQFSLFDVKMYNDKKAPTGR